MIEALGILLIAILSIGAFFGLIAGIVGLEDWSIKRKSAHDDVESAIEAGNHKRLSALLATRSHLLRKDVRINAELWLQTQDDARAKKGLK